MKRGLIFIGFVLIILGLISLVNQIFPDLTLGRFVGPVFLIALGVFLILRPKIAGQNAKVQIPVLGDLRNTGSWEVTQHEVWWFVGSNRLDFTDAVFPEGDGVIKIYGFVNDITIIVPDDVGLEVISTAFVNDYHGLHAKQERFLSTLEEQTPNYLSADKRVHVQSFAFVAEIKVRPSM